MLILPRINKRLGNIIFNLEDYTYNLVNLLLRVGLGEDTFYFTTQGIMKDLAFAYNDSVSTYMADDSKTPW